MRKFMGSLLALLLLLGVSSVARAQGRGAAPVNNAPFDPHDLSGIWSGLATADNLTKDEPPMLPWAMAKYKSEKTEYSTPPVGDDENTDPLFRCEPGSVPRFYFNGHPIEILQTPKETIMLLETYRNFRIIYTDGRKAPDHPEGTWYGDSVGHWEGNTLVVDTYNFNDKTWVDKVGHPHTDKMHLIERFTRTGHDTLKSEITIDDPGAYTAKWGGVKNFVLKSDWQIEDYMCSPKDEEDLFSEVRNKATNRTDGKKQ